MALSVADRRDADRPTGHFRMSLGGRRRHGHAVSMRPKHPTIHLVGRTISFQFDDRRIDAVDGETVGAALSAAGITTFRHTPSGAPRGLFCGMGACFDCVVTVDGRIGQRACLTQAVDGMRVASGFPAELASEPAPPAEERDCDVLVVGGGVAGLSAAIAAAEARGVRRRSGRAACPGGQFAKPLAPSHTDTAPGRAVPAGRRPRARAEQAGVSGWRRTPRSGVRSRRMRSPPSCAVRPLPTTRAG